MRRTIDQIMTPTEADAGLNDIVIAQSHNELVDGHMPTHLCIDMCLDALLAWSQEPTGPYARYWWDRACAFQAAVFQRLRDAGTHTGFCPFNDLFYWGNAEHYGEFPRRPPPRG